jgi:hypothetical protein
MNIEQELRARVLRILERGYRCEDLTRLLIYSRDPPHDLSRPLVTEIGNSIAHPRGRDRGLFTNAAKDFFAIITFMIHAGERAGINFESLPECFKSHIEAMARCVGPKYLESATGFTSREAAIQTAKGVLTRLKKNADDTYALPTNMTAKEKNLIAAFTAAGIPPRPLDSKIFVRDFADILVGTELLRQDERPAFESTMKIPVILFAIAAMHHVPINMPGSKHGVLMAAADSQNNLTTLFSTTVDFVDGVPRTIAARFFVTELPACNYCNGHFPLDSPWDFPMELDDRTTQLIRLDS